MMKRLPLTVNWWFRLCVVLSLVLGASAVHAEVVDLFTEEVSPSVWNQKIAGSTNTYGNIAVDPPTPFGDGKALRMYDFTAFAKAELRGEVVDPILEPFRADFQFYNQSPTADTESVIFRMGNGAGESVTAEDRAAFTLSWQSTGVVSATYDPPVTPTDDIPNVESEVLPVGVHSVTLIGNAQTNNSYAYTLFGQPRTLAAQSYDVWVDGVLLTNSTSGLPFTRSQDGSVYDPEDGLKQYGMIGSDTSGVGVDFLFDNCLLRTEVLFPGAPQLFTAMRSTAENGFEFLSETGKTYVVQWSTNAMEEFPIWTDAGMAVEGDGSTRVLFDPAGYDAGKTYRVGTPTE